MSIKGASAALALLLPLAAPVRARSTPPLDDETLAVLSASLDVPAVSYEGEVAVLTRHKGSEKARTLLVRFSPPARYRREVVDARGFTRLLIVSDGESEWVYDRRRHRAWKGRPADADLKLFDPDEELALLERNYDFTLGEDETTAGRRCRVLAARSRRDGRLVRRLWVDAEHGLVLRREIYLADGSLSSSMSWTRLRIPAPADDWDFEFEPPSGTKVFSKRIEPDYMEIEDAATATNMTPRLPEWLPTGYVFESVNVLPYRGATILHYRYSDGMDVLSLFQAPRRTRVRFAGMATVGGGTLSRVRIGRRTGRLALGTEGKFLEWADGDRFILLGRLGTDKLRRVAGSLKAAVLSGEVR